MAPRAILPSPSLPPVAAHFHYDRSLYKFDKFVEDHLCKGTIDGFPGTHETPDPTCSAFYVPESDCKTFFADRLLLEEIVHAACKQNESVPKHPPVSLSTLQKSFTKVFSILLAIKRGSFIAYFMTKDGLSDAQLPFHTRPAQFPGSLWNQFWPEFFERQWMFCVPNLEYTREKEWDSKRILPFQYKRRLGGGGSAVTYEIEVHPDYNKLRANPKDEDLSDGDPNTFALKIFREDKANEWQNEVEAYIQIRTNREDDPALVRFFGSFKHQKGSTFNIILEYADGGTLEKYFRDVTPPSEYSDIHKFWTGLLGILRGVRILHNLQYKHFKTQRWHQDIKPDNILVSYRKGKSKYESAFKVTDLDTSHFRVKQDDRVRDSDARGTRTYGAPECYRSDPSADKRDIQVTAKVDVFSVGCLFSEAATWLVKGYEGLQKYREDRKRSHDPESFRDSDCFHDGIDVLPMVVQHHEELQEIRRKRDKITGWVLIHLIPLMLVREEERLPADELSKMAGNAIFKYRRSMLDNTQEERSNQFLEHASFSDCSFTEFPIATEFGPAGRRSLPPVPSGHTNPHRPKLANHGRNVSSPISETSGLSRPLQPNHGVDFLDISQSNAGYLQSTSRIDQNCWPILGPSLSADQSQPSALNGTKSMLGIPDSSMDLSNSKGRNPHGTLEYPKVGISMPRQNGTLSGSPNSYHPTAGQDSGIPSLLGDEYWSYADPNHAVWRGITRPEFPMLHNGEFRPHNSLPESQGNSMTPIDKSVGKRHLSPAALSSQAAPFWSIEEVRSRRKCRKGLDDPWKKELENRDYIFIIDNSTSMAAHWDDVMDLLDCLGYMVKEFDTNGMELCFTTSQSKETVYKNATPLVTEAKKHRPKPTKPGDEVMANIKASLGSCIDSYRAKIQRGRSPKRLLIYFLTDGRWQPESDVEQNIISLVAALNAHHMPNMQVGIQFIQFGDDEEAFKRLEKYDSGLGVEPDIVDSEPFKPGWFGGRDQPVGGNMWKMILGSVNKWADHTNEPESAAKSLQTPTEGSNSPKFDSQSQQSPSSSSWRNAPMST